MATPFSDPFRGYKLDDLYKLYENNPARVNQFLGLDPASKITKEELGREFSAQDNIGVEVKNALLQEAQGARLQRDAFAGFDPAFLRDYTTRELKSLLTVAGVQNPENISQEQFNDLFRSNSSIRDAVLRQAERQTSPQAVINQAAFRQFALPSINQAEQQFASQRSALEQQVAAANQQAQQQAQSYADTLINAYTQTVAQQYQPGTVSQDQIRREALTSIARNQLKDVYVPLAQDLPQLEQAIRGELYNTALPQAENFIVRPILGQLDALESQYAQNVGGIQDVANQSARQAVSQLNSYIANRQNEVNSELARLDQTGELTPEKARAIQGALRAETSFLTGPQFGFTPEAYEQAKNVYQQSYTQNLQNLSQLARPEVPQAPVVPQVAQQTAPQITPPLAAPVTQQPAPLSAPLAAPTTQEVTQPPLVATQPTTPVATPAVAQPTTVAPVTQPAMAATVTQPTQAPVVQAPATQPSFLGGIPVGLGQPTTTQPVQSTGIPMATTPLSPENLPELRSAGGGGASAIDPTLRPYLELGLRAAEQQFLQNVPQFFPGQTYVSPSQQTLDALAAQEQIARQAPSTLQAAQESYMRGMGGLGATASGAFLMGNPYQQQMIQAATRPIMQQFEEQTLPGIAGGFSQAGRYGSGAMERALGRAAETTARAIGDVSTNIAFQDYGAERGRQQQAILGQITAAQVAPQIYGQQFLPSQQLAQIGAAREQIAGLPLQEQMQRFQFAQQAPRESLNAFLSSIYGTPLAGSQYAPTPQAQTNRFGNVLGGAATGAAIGSMIPGVGAGVGAGVGILGGLIG
jgi:hypothetical protein